MKHNYSLSEIDVTCRRAARGIGFSWGLAEETGKSVRFLSSYGADGPSLLVSYFNYIKAKNEIGVPALLNGVWQDSGKQKLGLCPITVGAIIGDRISLIKNHSITFNNVLFPVLTIAGIGYASLSFGGTFLVKITGNNFNTDIYLNGIQSDIDALIAEKHQADTLSVSYCNDDLNLKSYNCKGFEVSKENWDLLNYYASFLYVPDDAKSVSEAGAGLLDND